MVFERKPSFDRSWNSLTPLRKEKAAEALEKLVRFFEGGPKPEGLGLKKLKNPFWEIRTDLKIGGFAAGAPVPPVRSRGINPTLAHQLKDRILFSLQKNIVSFVLIGNHDEIHRALKRG